VRSCIAHYSNVIKCISRCLQCVKVFKWGHRPLNKLSNGSLGNAWLFILPEWESLPLMKLGLKPLWTVNTFSFNLYLFNEHLNPAVLVISPLSPSNSLNMKSQSRGHTQCWGQGIHNSKGEEEKSERSLEGKNNVPRFWRAACLISAD